VSIATLILGETGTGKSSSLRNMDPAKTLLIQTIPKPLPFKSGAWKPLSKDGGNIIVSSDFAQIVGIMQKTTRPVIVVDDFQYLLVTEFMRRAYEKGYDKFNEMGVHYYEVLKAATELPAHKRAYLMSHTDTNESGRVKAKTIGKMLDEKVTVEGLVTLVLRTQVINGKYVFSTKNNGSDTVKTSMGLFEEEHIDNDLAAVDAAIVAYYELQQAAA
jgi:hypothetical protein